MSTTHGWVAYSNGCRCAVCREAWRLHYAEYVQRRKAGADRTDPKAEQGRRAARIRWGAA